MTRRPIIDLLVCIQLCFENTILYFLISDIGNGNKGGFIITLRTPTLNGPFVLSCWCTTRGSPGFNLHFPVGRMSCVLQSPTKQPYFTGQGRMALNYNRKNELMTMEIKLACIVTLKQAI